MHNTKFDFASTCIRTAFFFSKSKTFFTYFTQRRDVDKEGSNYEEITVPVRQHGGWAPPALGPLLLLRTQYWLPWKLCRQWQHSFLCRPILRTAVNPVHQATGSPPLWLGEMMSWKSYRTLGVDNTLHIWIRKRIVSYKFGSLLLNYYKTEMYKIGL